MSDLLLDTHVVVWWLSGDRRLTASARRRIEAGVAHVSAVTTWEVAIKSAIGKLRVDLDDGESFADRCRSVDFRLIDVTHADAWAVRDLPGQRSDPFDRLIAATARRRGWTVVSADPVFTDLGVPVIDASA